MNSSSSSRGAEHDHIATLVIVSGRPGSGKSTLATSLARHLAWPLISRDEINNGMKQVLGDSASKNDLAERTFVAFCDLLRLMTSQKVAFIAESAFQKTRWRLALDPVLPEVDVRLIQCVVDPRMAQERVRLRKGLSEPAVLPDIAEFDPLSLPAPTLTVSTVDGYDPPLAEIAAFARS